MKKFATILLFLLAVTLSAAAQDLITKRTGEVVRAKVLEVNVDTITYNLYDMQEGAVFTLRKAEVASIVFQNGHVENFEGYTYQSQHRIPEGVMPGMSYKDYRKLYNQNEYVHYDGDKYSPLVGGLCSFLLPGMGQIICGEAGRGFGYLGAYVGTGLVTLVGYSVILDNASSIYPVELWWAATSLALLSVHVCSIVDGVRVARIKNMYYRDVNNLPLASGMEVKLTPFTSFALTGQSTMSPVAGARLSINF